jgi:hypothetical protein
MGLRGMGNEIPKPSPSHKIQITERSRCSDKGVLAMPIEEYLALLAWTARQSVSGKRGSIPGDMPPVLRRLGLDGKTWCELVGDFGKLFCHVAGRPEHVDTIRSHRTHRLTIFAAESANSSQQPNAVAS